ncbi:cysteine synthase A [Lentisphaerota bacterium ZTH]|nr:cysteine synthase A [Lentisphaerota bacterium]WET06116.1 cysteine synthase A [Lentisphaerota bacterium ZTH]
MKYFHDITGTIGNTPLVRINRLDKGHGTVLCKLEYFNPLSSIKDRPAMNIIDEAIEAGKLIFGGTIIEATSGNTGLGLAMVSAALGYRLIIVMPESMSSERGMLMRHLGAELVLTPAEEGMAGAVAKAEELGRQIPNAYMARQFNNPANPNIHYSRTGPEIWRDTEGRVDIFVVGVGTGGTITGIGKFLKEKNPSIKIVAVEPEKSAILSGGEAGPHSIQGIGAGFVPENYDAEYTDEVITVSDEEAIAFSRKAAATEGILTGISGGANLKAACLLSERPENIGKMIVTIAPDTGERYLSTRLFEHDG